MASFPRAWQTLWGGQGGLSSVSLGSISPWLPATMQTVQDNNPGTNQDVTVIDTRYLPNLTTIYYRVLVY